jgi:hypothetical protein
MPQDRFSLFKQSLTSALPPSSWPYVLENLIQFRVDMSLDQAWSYLSETSKMNRELGFPPREEIEIEGELHVKAKTLGRQEHWIERPWVWVHHQELQNHRIFKKGWMKEQRGVFAVRELSQGVEISVYFRWCFDSFFSKKLFALIGPILLKNIRDYFHKKEALVKNIQSGIPLPPPLPKSVYEQRLEEILKELRKKNDWQTSFEPLIEYFLSEDEMELDRIHLKKVAKKTGLPLELLFGACRVLLQSGHLSLSWDVVCPHCRGPRSHHFKVESIEQINHCDACAVTFEVNLPESIEIVFLLTETLRKIEAKSYCAAEPARKKHIKFSQQVDAHETIELKLGLLPPGRYFLIAKSVADIQAIDLNNEMTKQSWSWTNPLDKPTILTVQEAWWTADSLLPGEVLSRPEFRDFLTHEHLKVGVQLNVGEQVILFTDIVGSTPFYRQLGDAGAFQAVLKHYLEVGELIKKHNGVIIKFIGDAVMAAFLDINAAFLCTKELYEIFPNNREDTPIRLRASLHKGPVLCANLNVGLDYFGNTVNLAAKIQKWAEGQQLAMIDSDWQQLDLKIIKEIKNMRVEEDDKLSRRVHIIDF